MPKKPSTAIAFYDSGAGGLTILKEFISLTNGKIPFIYYADTASLPLGEKTVTQIRDRVKIAAKYLFKQGVSLIILACNTASVNTIRHMQQVWLPENYPDGQVLSISTPIIQYLNHQHLKPQTKGLILATKGTHQNGFYQYKLIRNGYTNFKSVACTGLATAIEKQDTELIGKLLNSYNADSNLNPNQIETIILACTHYEWAKDEIAKVFTRANILCSGNFIAKKTLDYINRHGYEFSKSQSKIVCTGSGFSLNNYLKKINFAI